jgi:hypothetical protein
MQTKRREYLECNYGKVNANDGERRRNISMRMGK